MHISILQHNSSSDPYSYILESHRKTSIMVTPPLQLARQVPPPPIPKLETIFVVTTISRRLGQSRPVFFTRQIILRQNSLLTSNHLTISKQLRYTLFFIFFSTEKCVRDIDPLFTRGRRVRKQVYFCYIVNIFASAASYITVGQHHSKIRQLQEQLFRWHVLGDICLLCAANFCCA